MTKKTTQKQPKTTTERIQAFLEDLQKVEKQHKLSVSVDDVNPFQLVVRDTSSDLVISWLGTEDVRWDDNYAVVAEN